MKKIENMFYNIKSVLKFDVILRHEQRESQRPYTCGGKDIQAS